MGAADASDGALVAKQRMELAALPSKDLGQRRLIEVERIGP